MGLGYSSDGDGLSWSGEDEVSDPGLETMAWGREQGTGCGSEARRFVST